MDLEDQFRLLQPRLEACVLALQLRHACVLGCRFDDRFGGGLRVQPPLFVFLTPATDNRRVEPFTAQDLSDLPDSCTGCDLSENVALLCLGKPTPDGSFHDLRIGWDRELLPLGPIGAPPEGKIESAAAGTPVGLRPPSVPAAAGRSASCIPLSIIIGFLTALHTSRTVKLSHSLMSHRGDIDPCIISRCCCHGLSLRDNNWSVWLFATQDALPSVVSQSDVQILRPFSRV